ncbi:AGAP013186-PA-like protein [Anopheles sinensis]|uniref:AGAP013186-PA-like protein n=1 Tax=Anopheles sinensis TaxID=74873 RepID=A0A084WNY4_ANOSI|nr:AGAP013186-PA-like protein [Anopheles sinensis]
MTILHNPTSVQIESNHISELHIPTDLQEGEFKRNSISDIHTKSSLSYAITYLDLLDNSLSDISNLSALVNLQTLNLEGNNIRKVDETIFAEMHNLSTLYLGDNYIKQLDFKGFPKALTKLWLGKNQLSNIDLVNVSLPVLTMLDLERNLLETIDMARFVS